MFNEKNSIYIFTCIGLLLGFTLDLLFRYEITNYFPYGFLIISAVLYGISFNGKNLTRLALTSIAAAILLSLPLIPLNINSFTQNPERMFSFAMGFPVFVYIGHCFHYAFHHDNKINISYSSLFAAVWNTIPLLFVAVLFSVLANSLLSLTSLIFAIFGFNFLWGSEHIRFILYVGLFFIGLGIAQQNFKIIYNLRFLGLRIMHYLFPFLALISIIYFILYLTRSLFGSSAIIGEPLHVLFPLTMSGILFFNSYFQDGSIHSSYPAGISLGLKVYRIILFILSIMLAYYVLKKTELLLSINIGLYLLITVLYCLAYAATALMSSDKERKWIPELNIAIALFFLVGMLIINNPIKPINYMIGSHPGVLFPPKIGQPLNNTVDAKTKLQTIDQKLTKLNLSWQKNIDTNSFVAAFDGNVAVYICRTVFNEGYQIGQFSNNQCRISYAGKAFSVQDYQILSGSKDKLRWIPSFNAPNLPLGFEPVESRPLRELYACRVIYDNHIYIGKLVDNQCNIAVGDEEKVAGNSDMLTTTYY